MRDDRRLSNQIVAGDHGTFAAFVDCFGPRLHRLVCRYTACEADAEDLTQEDAPLWVPALLVGRYGLREYRKRQVA